MPLHGDESKLKDVQLAIPGIQVDLRYSTKNNFTGQIIYNFKNCLLLEETISKLSDVQAELEKTGLGLKIWDGYRPIETQWKFWELVPDERYVADPRKGGVHTRGTSVNVTLITKNGEELPMPSAFDEFSEKSHRNFMDGKKEEFSNRDLLQKVMERHGFIGDLCEWWHFDLVEWSKYPPIGVDQ